MLPTTKSSTNAPMSYFFQSGKWHRHYSRTCVSTQVLFLLAFYPMNSSCRGLCRVSSWSPPRRESAEFHMRSFSLCTNYRVETLLRKQTGAYFVFHLSMIMCFICLKNFAVVVLGRRINQSYLCYYLPGRLPCFFLSSSAPSFSPSIGALLFLYNFF